MDLGSFLLRDAWQIDIEAVLLFYKKNRSKNNAIREDEQLVRAIDDKQLLLVVDQHNEIQAASGSFRYEGGSYVEVGATFVTPDLRGFKIQMIFVRVHALMEDIVNPDFSRFFAVVRADNVASINNLREAGFAPASPDAVVSRLKRNLAEKYYFELPRRCRYRHARMLLGVEDAPVRHRKNGDTLSLKLDVGILHPEWRHIICAFAAFGNDN